MEHIHCRSALIAQQDIFAAFWQLLITVVGLALQGITVYLEPPRPLLVRLGLIVIL
jgi:hypothetical protein